MNSNKLIQKLRTLVLTAAALALTAGPALAVDLVAVQGEWLPPGGTVGVDEVTMWGFASDNNQACDSLPAWTVGPRLTDTDVVAGDLTINLRNCLNEPVSIIIPGQPATFTPQTITDAQGRTRITAFTNEAAASGGTASYTWIGVKDGTYLYQSGSHPAKQVQMGLYGALTLGSYTGTSGDVTLLYSEIDPALHGPPAAATPLDYKPRHYLVNGMVEFMPDPPAAVGDTNQPIVLRFLNAGLDFHVPALNGGHMTLVAEDGNPYPFTKEQYSANLAAGKTIDALWQPTSAGDHVIYDRRGNGMVATLTVGAVVGAPIANDDLLYTVDEDNPLNVAANGVLANDTDASLAVLTVPPATANLNSSTSSGSLTLNADGSFTYTPNADFNGTDSFTYRANDGSLDSNVASVSITVTPGNDAPVADPNGPYTAVVNDPVTLDGTGSFDIDVGDTLTYAWDFGDTTSGTGAMPSHTYATTGTYTVSLVVNDGIVDSPAVTTPVEVVDAVNTAPVAVEDTATVVRNSTAAFINLTDNDSDVDGNLKDGSDNVAPGQINITTGLTTTRGGMVTVVTNGVNYTPKRNFRGTDTFNYTVTDLAGAESNEVTVRVNVVRP